MKGLNVRILDKTRDDDTSTNRDTRGHQIKDWLDAHKGSVKNFLILDDNTWDIMGLFPQNTITIKEYSGFDALDLQHAKTMLGL